MENKPEVCDLPAENIEELEQIHRKERKDLQAKIQALKKSCAKGDKKKKKEVADEIAKLEADLDKKQEEEVRKITNSNSSVEEISEEVEALGIDSAAEKAPPRLTKAQKRRDKKAEKDKEREVLIAQQEVDNKLGPRHREQTIIQQLLQARKLRLFEVPSNGDCLYLAIEHQLKELNRPLKKVVELRRLTAEYLRAHEEDLRPFTCNPTTGCEFSPEEYSSYCGRVESDSSEWGGQLELQALSEALSTPIEVLQAEGAPVLLGDNHRPKLPLVLTYHRHAFGLGEHYNSVTADERE
ncbi:deubiquitinase OTUD6B [Neocloeon triangulifer]|uniref:deubiquitinase OTUD6B n=1 Tax=Neocloeon triangulifer TaxID=2078957 RepID=UPI00286EB558|nr:deubiquitinase OTUD6B [Neocloeon triangulifer]